MLTRQQVTIVEPSYAELLKVNGLHCYSDFMGGDESSVVGRSGTTCTRRICLGRSDDAASGGIECYLKRYEYAGDRWRHRFRMDKATIEARNYRILRERVGLYAPTVLAHGSRRAGMRLLDAFLLTRGVPNAVSLDRLVEKPTSSRPAACGERGRILAATAESVGRMHAAGFYHIDLQWRNILVADAGASDPKVYLFDCPRGGLRGGGARGYHGRLRDLSSLFKEARVRLTPGEQLRWLGRYLAVAPIDVDCRNMIQTILRDRDSKDRPVST